MLSSPRSARGAAPAPGAVTRRGRLAALCLAGDVYLHHEGAMPQTIAGSALPGDEQILDASFADASRGVVTIVLSLDTCQIPQPETEAGQAGARSRQDSCPRDGPIVTPPQVWQRRIVVCRSRPLRPGCGDSRVSSATAFLAQGRGPAATGRSRCRSTCSALAKSTTSASG